ncbi:MAG: hypothetical protein CMF22_10045 [Idiomarinaceae bacterium]|nr:hypothetical protein [Idiomarinaceae bacterium]MBG23782.1 hypothetical protein [Idiomarinaceae bacterium]|tara:strand:+ start:57646 stop:58191 length:546 start_codon:yes stop_codon:yes gene_type:complete
MFLQNIEDAILVTMNDYFNIPVILEHQGGPEPTGDYGVFGLLTFNKVNRNKYNSYKSGADFKERIQQDYYITATLRFYGDSCYDNAFEAQSVLQLKSTQEELYTFNCISILDITNVRRLPELRDTGYIQKASFDINMLVGYEFVRDVDWFDTVSYEGEYVDLDGNVILTEDETVSASDYSP